MTTKRKRPVPTEHEGIYKMPSGGFCVRWWTWKIVDGEPKHIYDYDSTDGGIREAQKLLAKCKAGAKTKKEALDDHANRIEQALHPELHRSNDRAIASMISFYFNSNRFLKAEKSQITRRRRVSHFEKFCKDRGIAYVSQFVEESDDRPSYAFQYYQYCVKNFKFKGIANHLLEASAIFKLENKRPGAIIKWNPFDDIDKDQKPEHHGDPRFVTEEEVEALYSVAKEYEYRLLDLLYNGGLRVGELQNLLWTMIIGGDLIDLTKHPTWKRKPGVSPYINLTETAIDHLRYFRLLNGHLPYVVLGDRAANDHYMWKLLRRVIKRAKEDVRYKHLTFAGVSPHGFRRSTGTMLLNEEGVAIGDVQSVMRHGSDRTTSASYAAPLARKSNKVVSKLPQFKREQPVQFDPEEIPYAIRQRMKKTGS